jgi:excisionase family DNA binding protein
MTNRRPLGANAPTGNAAGEDDLTRLVRLIARQAAQEALKAFTDGLATSTSHSGAASGPPFPRGNKPREADPAERWLTVAAVAERLGVSEKWVRRKAASGELPAHRVGRLVRIGERGLAAYVARARPGEGGPR